jgi:peptidoglycan/LPS O-acetylase OafA/YrhL
MAFRKLTDETPQLVKSHHRRDIDGLRAVAVMGVILHHAGVSLVGSGFAGVDIFFVISGFLIGGIVATEMEHGEFSWHRFYARRARRILPMLFVVILVSLMMGWITMTPEQLRYFGGGAISTLMFLSNLWFYNQIDYFNPDAAEDPLIHTWSLAIEEQFYIFLPVLLFLIWRFGARVRVCVLTALAFVSFVVTLEIGPDDPMAAFYLIHARAWELLAGVLAALGFSRAQAVGRAAGLFADVGFALVVVGLFLVPHSALWPGPWTLLPVGGTVLLVLYGHRTSLARSVLQLPLVVSIGLISYSAYLWHQPIIGFLAIHDSKPEDWVGIGLLVLATLALAALTWQLIEQPFRNGVARSRSGHLTLWIAGIFIAGFAIGGHATKGYPLRVPPEVREMLAWSASVPESYRRCIGGRKEGERLDPASACIHGANEAPPIVAIWGDSHAAVLANPLGNALAVAGIGLRELSASSCMPVSGVRNTALKRAEYCAVHNSLMMDYMLADPNLRVVVIFAYWNSYAESRDFNNKAGAIVRDKLVAVPLDKPDQMLDEERIAALAVLMKGDLLRLVRAGKRVIILGPIPEPGFDLPDRLGRDMWLGIDSAKHMEYPEEAFADYAALAKSIITSAASELPSVTLLDPAPLFCKAGATCSLVKNGEPLFFDSNHLSLAGSALVVPYLAEAVKAALEPGD